MEEQELESREKEDKNVDGGNEERGEVRGKRTIMMRRR